MTRIQGHAAIPSNVTYNEEEGVTLRATRGTSSAAATTSAANAQSARSANAQGTVQDTFEAPRAQPSMSPAQVMLQSGLRDARERASALLERANCETPGPCVSVPAPRTENFQQLVDRQHDRAFRDGAMATGSALLGLVTGGAISGIGQRIGEAMGRGRRAHGGRSGRRSCRGDWWGCAGRGRFGADGGAQWSAPGHP
ncbi:MAG: hypothetical protein Q8Q09_07745 [Deltaproteobacteria bacterium]|nr:hypothetical protein [Deltaproteobacteria bacterium]